jgi:heat shock protein HslJ
MTETQLEDDLRATFRAAAETVPPAADLAPRAAEGVRRDRRSWTASGAAVIAVVAVAVAGTALDDDIEPAPVSAPAPQAVVPSPTGAPVTDPPVTDPPAMDPPVEGQWRAVRISGFGQLRMQRPEHPFLAFNPDGTWTGSDGCNSLSGTYTVGPRGELTTTNNGQRLVGCHNVPHVHVLSTAVRIEVTKPALRFFDQKGGELAAYVRTP